MKHLALILVVAGGIYWYTRKKPLGAITTVTQGAITVEPAAQSSPSANVAGVDAMTSAAMNAGSASPAEDAKVAASGGCGCHGKSSSSSSSSPATGGRAPSSPPATSPLGKAYAGLEAAAPTFSNGFSHDEDFGVQPLPAERRGGNLNQALASSGAWWGLRTSEPMKGAN